MILSGWIYQPSILHENFQTAFIPTKQAELWRPNGLMWKRFSSSHVFFSSCCFWWPTLHPPSLRVQGRRFLPCIFSSSSICFFGCSHPCVSFSVTSCISCSLKRVCIKCPNSLTAITEISLLANQKHTFCTFGFAGSFLEDSRVLVEVCKRTGIAYITFLGFAYFNAVRKMQMKRVWERGIPIEACLFLVWSRNGL